MPSLLSTHVEVYPFRRKGRRVEFLTLRRSAGRTLPGVWQPVTGKREGRETALRAAVRELREETGLGARRWWVLEGATVYFDARVDRVKILPRFAAEVDPKARVVISSEHDSARFRSAAAAARSFLWASQRASIEVIVRRIVPDGAAARALELRGRR